ncbi:MAG: transposase [Deltaproteobacteria bacterium]|nr:transposase [Deltaproteobacteria bacterium]
MKFAYGSYQMGRDRRILQSDFPYHIFNRVNNSEHLYDLTAAFNYFLEHLIEVGEQTNFRPYHFILMGNHYHLIGSTPNSNLSEFMQIFQTQVSKSLNRLTNRKDHFFKNRYGATIINNEKYLFKVISYLYQNPVRANVAQSPFVYPYSTLKIYLSNAWEKYKLYWGPGFENLSLSERLNFLKQLCSSLLDDYESKIISHALRGSIFTFD